VSNLTVGQTLWYVPRELRFQKPSEVTVQKIGRKWAQVDYRLRIDVQTLIADGGDYSSPGRCYLSREEYEAELARRDAWRDFCKLLRWSRQPRAATIEAIEQAQILLGLKRPASATEARSGETAGLDPKDKGAVGEAETP
jgi:hypothetical protein